MANEQEELVTKIKSLLQKEYGDASITSTRKLFDKYDTNKDGKINDKELEVLLKDAGIGNALTRGAWIKGIIGALDKNGDKQIDWTEFEAAISLVRKAAFPPRRAPAFSPRRPPARSGCTKAYSSSLTGGRLDSRAPAFSPRQPPVRSGCTNTYSSSLPGGRLDENLGAREHRPSG